MGIWRQIRNGLKNPDKLARTLVSDPQRVGWRAFNAIRDDIFRIHCYYYRGILKKSGIDMMEQDWDNLFLLDACRYDLFKSSNTIDGNLSKVISPGSGTKEFYQRMLSGRSFPGTVFLTANPHFTNVDCEFHDVVHLWKDCWDSKLKTVKPEVAAKETLRISADYPNKRIFVHFIQPHYPFIGPTGNEIEHGSLMGDGVISEERDELSIWDQLRLGWIDEETVKKAYRENLELTLPHVHNLINELEGKSVVTSDHGNTFGTFGEYGHPQPRFFKPLIEIPWLETTVGDRRTIERGPTHRARPESEKISERLSSLGYK